jgi:hypothetical protein
VQDQDETTQHLFLVERYDDSGTPDQQQPVLPPPPDVPLLFAVRVAADDVVLALVEGPDEVTVGASLTAAGWRVDRISAATWTDSRPGGSS